jgi:hypothetical protein
MWVGEQFSSLFTCIYDMDEVYTLWDFMCAHGDPFFPYYYGLAFLLNKRYNAESMSRCCVACF